MPKSGSQVILCDVPIRYDNYIGCSHACKYCFVNRKCDITKVKIGESPNSLLDFIKGKRDKMTEWCDWNIPIHWGGMSDPFQPVEQKCRTSLKCLEIFAETQYPFIVSTKNKLIAEEPYLSLIKQCNCVVQFSAACSKYNQIETGASTFEERVEAASKISPYKRVNIRVQPYIPEMFRDIRKSLKLFADAGVYGVIFEAMKYFTKHKGCIKIGGDIVYPTSTLKPQFEILRDTCHELGMKFYSGENRLRSMGDSLCCCGVDGMGWRVNTANLNHFLYDKENYKITEQMKVSNIRPFKAIHQDVMGTWLGKNRKFADLMEMHCNSKSSAKILMEDELTKQ